MHDIPSNEKVISTGSIPFKLWLEFEETTPCEDVENDFANIIVDTLDGAKYAINTWTFGYQKIALANEKQEGNENYLNPPDLFVKALTRDCIESVISDLLETGPLDKILNPSVFSLNFIDPYWDAWDMEDSMIVALIKQLRIEMPKSHVLRNRSFELLAKDQRNDDIILELDDESIAVVHLTWRNGREASGFPSTRIFPSHKAYWKKEMRVEILDYNDD